MAQLQSSSSNHKKIEKYRAELKRLQMCRLKQSQNVPLIIKEIDTQTVYHFRKLFNQETLLTYTTQWFFLLYRTVSTRKSPE